MLLRLRSAAFFICLSLVLQSWALPSQREEQEVFVVDGSSISEDDILYGVEHYSTKIHRPHRGTLRKFKLSEDDPSARERILNIASEENLDIWHLSPSEVHIYTPEDEPSHQSLLYEPHTEVPIDASPSLSSSHTGSENWNLASFSNSTFHSVYHPLFEVDEFVKQLEGMYPDKVGVAEIGHSAEGREMVAITISSTPRELEGGGLGREEEWVLVEAEGSMDSIEPEPSPGPDKPKKDKKKKKKDKKKGRGKKDKKGKKGKKTRPPPPEKAKLGFVVVGAQHAREWIATATALYFAHALAANTTEPHSMGGLLDVYDFYIIPVPNPDGYDYTWEYDRFWYKNRQIIGPKAKCIGLDMNRNWGYKWKPDGDGNGMLFPQSSTNSSSFTADTSTSVKPKPADPCSHWYPGLRAFEAPEANNIANYVNTLPNVVAFVDLRSYGQMLSSPYSYSCKRVPKDAEDQIEAALGAAQALKKSYGTAFKTGSLCQNLYRAPGNIVDYMYARAGIKYSYVAHLRDTGTYGFSLPEKWIRPVGEETGNMIGYMAQFIARQLGRTV